MGREDLRRDMSTMRDTASHPIRVTRASQRRQVFHGDRTSKAGSAPSEEADFRSAAIGFGLAFALISAAPAQPMRRRPSQQS